MTLSLMPSHKASKTQVVQSLQQFKKSRFLLGVMSLCLATGSTQAADVDENSNSEVSILPTIQLSAEKKQTTEQTKSYTIPQSNSSTGLALSLKETPQSVSVVTRQQLDDKAAQTIDDVLTSTTGITFTQLDNGARTTYRARGFDISNYKADGLSIQGASAFSGAGNSINMDLYDHVNIIRGANGLLGGTGDPSATIDLVRKLPKKDFSGSVSLRTGSWDKKSLVGDINVPLTADGSVRSRLVVSGEDSGSFRDHEKIERQGVLASIEIDASDDTTIGAGVQYEHSITKGASWGTNVPIWYADGTETHFSRSLNLATNWSKTEREGTTFFTSLESRFDNGWKLNSHFSHTEREDLNNLGIVKINTGAVKWPHWSQDGTGAYLNAIHQEIESTNDALDLSLSGKFQLFNRTHDLMFGLNGSETLSTSYTFNSSNCNIDGVTGYRSSCQYRTELPVTNWLTWTGSEYGNFNTFRTAARAETNTTVYGGYAAARFNIIDDLSLITGVRRSNYKSYVDNYNTAGVKTSRTGQTTAQVWTPYYGLVYDINPTYSVYASYTDVFTPQNKQNTSGQVLDPITGQSYEAGIKGSWFDDNLNASFAVYKAVLANVAITDGSNTTPDGSQAYYQGTGRKTQGFETEIAGSITPNWNVSTGYTYLSVVDKDTLERVDPRHLIRLNTTYDLSDALVQGLTMGMGMSLQSHTVAVPYPGRPLGSNTYDDSPIKVKGYALFDVMARYKINKNLSASLNVSNLLDKTYYRQYGFYNGLIYGEPRRFTVTLQAKF